MVDLILKFAHVPLMIQLSSVMLGPKIFAGTGVKLATSSKNHGHMSFSKISDRETEDNINHFVDNLGWDDSSRAFMRIVYGDNKSYDQITAVNSSNKPPSQFSKTQAIEADALITNVSEVALLLPTADCYPVTMVDPVNNVIALNHIGWHSTAAHLLQKAVNRMKDEFGSNPSDLLVHIGPGIPAKYYVFEDPVQLNLPGWAPYLHKANGGYQIDLLNYNLEQLKQAGVNLKHIEQDPRNTVETDELESNYMHNKQKLQPAIRFLTAVMLG